MTSDALINKIKSSYSSKLDEYRSELEDELELKQHLMNKELQKRMTSFFNEQKAGIRKINQGKLSELKVDHRKRLELKREQLIDDIIRNTLLKFQDRMGKDNDFRNSYCSNILEIIDKLDLELQSIIAPTNMKQWIADNLNNPTNIQIIEKLDIYGMVLMGDNFEIDISPSTFIEVYQSEIRTFVKENLLGD